MPTSRLRQYPEQKNGPVTRSARLENRRRDGWPLPVCPEDLRGGWGSATRHFRVWRKRSASGASFRGLRGLPGAIRQGVEHYSGAGKIHVRLFLTFFVGGGLLQNPPPVPLPKTSHRKKAE